MCHLCPHYAGALTSMEQEPSNDRLPCDDPRCDDSSNPPPPPYSSKMTLGIRHNLQKSHHLYNEPEIEIVDMKGKPTGFIGSTEFIFYNLSAFNLHSSIVNHTKELKYSIGNAWVGAKEGDIGYNKFGKPVMIGVGSPVYNVDKHGKRLGWEEIYRYRCSKCKTPYISNSHKECDCPMEVSPPNYTTE